MTGQEKADGISKGLALFIPEATPTGTVYYPANQLAVKLAGVAGCRAIPEERFPYIRALGFEVAETNGTPLPGPLARMDVVA